MTVTLHFNMHSSVDDVRREHFDVVFRALRRYTSKKLTTEQTPDKNEHCIMDVLAVRSLSTL